MEHLFDEEFGRRLDHRFHSLAATFDPEWVKLTQSMEAQYAVIDAKQP
jgi:hypothetical protein